MFSFFVYFSLVALEVSGQAFVHYCPSANDLTIAYSASSTPKLLNQGWSISGGGGVATKSAFNLLGGYVSYDVVFNGVPTGVNANIYSISPPTFENGQYFNSSTDYCDGQGAAGTSGFCVEVDYVESNGNCGGASTLHDVPGTGPSDNCNGWGCSSAYQYSQWTGGSANFNMRLDFAGDGTWTSTTVNGKQIDPLYPSPTSYDWQQVEQAYGFAGAVIYSSQWVGWVPSVGNCPTNNGDLNNANMEIQNLVIYGHVTKGPIPTACSQEQLQASLYKFSEA